MANDGILLGLSATVPSSGRAIHIPGIVAQAETIELAVPKVESLCLGHTEAFVTVGKAAAWPSVQLEDGTGRVVGWVRDATMNAYVASDRQGIDRLYFSVSALPFALTSAPAGTNIFALIDRFTLNMERGKTYVWQARTIANFRVESDRTQGLDG